MFAIIISAGFMGMLTSYTNFPPKTRPITTLEQLSDALERKSVNLCIKNNRYYRDILTFHLRSASSVLKEHLEENLRMGDCMTTLCCLDKVSRGTHVFVTNREEARFYTGKDFKGAVAAEQDFFLVHVVMIAPKWSPYATAFAVVSQRLMETGVSMCALRRVRRRRADRSKFQEVSAQLGEKCFCRALKLNDLYGLLLVWAFGLTFALLVLGCEVAWKARLKTTRPCKKARHGKWTRRSREKPSLGQVLNPNMSRSVVVFGYTVPNHPDHAMQRRQRRVFVSLEKWRSATSASVGKVSFLHLK
ncbi:hypothetical protein MTO96_005935 [Rhipicephalus appendiculatus]